MGSLGVGVVVGVVGVVIVVEEVTVFSDLSVVLGGEVWVVAIVVVVVGIFRIGAAVLGIHYFVGTAFVLHGVIIIKVIIVITDATIWTEWIF